MAEPGFQMAQQLLLFCQRQTVNDCLKLGKRLHDKTIHPKTRGGKCKVGGTRKRAQEKSAVGESGGANFRRGTADGRRLSRWQRPTKFAAVSRQVRRLGREKVTRVSNPCRLRRCRKMAAKRRKRRKKTQGAGHEMMSRSAERSCQKKMTRPVRVSR
jgi:hypothetical protein